MKHLSSILGIALALPVFTLAAEEYTPWAGQDVPMRLLWGDTHLHSSFSVDANTMGNTLLNPADAYRFARGEAVRANTGMVAQLNTPLDFLVISDHAEQLGIMLKLREGDPRLLASPEGAAAHKAMTGDNQDDSAAEYMLNFLHKMASGEPLIANAEISESIWQESIAITDRHYDPGVFTPLIGFEWTSMPDSNNLHRVVVYADGADKAGQLQPVSSNDNEDPAALWDFMERYEKLTGGSIMAIPHNGNLSNGAMFTANDFSGEPMDAAYAQRRIRWEPIVEVTQIKGDGETHPFLSPDDEFADFETWDAGNFSAMQETNKTNDMLRFEYARSALRTGLELSANIGTNPYRFGMIGSTDSHTSLATGAEDNFWGKATTTEPAMARTQPSDLLPVEDPELDLLMPWKFVASGYAAVWARENTREEIFSAMQRREVYATSGSRITLRFFGGWGFGEDDVLDPHVVRNAYARGVPMGGQLSSSKQEAPGFLILAARDPHGANLDRIQVVKGWLDGEGTSHEKVYNVAVSDNREIRADGTVKPVRSTVNPTTASYKNSIGATELSAFWQDPEFDPQQPAFYYARVIEIPTPRWSTYDRARLGVELMQETPLEVQDRAYSSPIWYSAAN